MADFQAYFYIFVLCLIADFLIRSFFKSTDTKSRLPPSPFALPIIGHLHLLAPLPHRAFHKLSLRYGPIFRLFLGFKPCVVVCSSDAMKEFLKTNENAYLDRPRSSATDYISYGTKDMVFAPYGTHWKYMKKIVMSQLLNGPTLDLLSPVRHDEINRFMKMLSQNAKAGKSVDFRGELMKLTNNVISRMLMGERCTDKEGDENEVRTLVASITEIAGNFNLADHIWLFKSIDLQGLDKKVKSLGARFDSMVERIIEEHEEARKHVGHVKDLLHILLDISHDETMEEKMTRDNIKGFIMVRKIKTYILFNLYRPVKREDW